LPSITFIDDSKYWHIYITGFVGTFVESAYPGIICNTIYPCFGWIFLKIMTISYFKLNLEGFGILGLKLG